MAVEIVGASGGHVSTLGWPTNSLVWYDGKYWCCYIYAGTGAADNMKVAYADDSDLNFGTLHSVPYLGTLIRGYTFDAYYGHDPGYGVVTCLNAAAGDIAETFKDNDSLNSSGYHNSYNSITSVAMMCSITYDRDTHYWIASYVDTDIVIRRTVNISDYTNWVTSLTIAVGSLGYNAVQMVSYENGDVGCLYVIYSKAYYRHWTKASETWGSAELVTDKLAYYQNIRAVVTQNDKLFVAYKGRDNALEDFSLYTETDPSSDINIQGGCIEVTTMTRSVDAYVYKDFGVNYFNGDFTIYANVTLTALTNSGLMFFASLTNSIDDMNGIDVANGSALGAYINRNTSAQYIIGLRELDSGTIYDDQYIGASLDAMYYLKFVRDEAVGTYGTIYCYIYSDESHSTLVDTLTLTLHSSKKDFRYLFGVQSFNSSSATLTASGKVESICVNADNYNTGKLSYVIRPVGGSFGSAGTIATDIAGSFPQPYFTSCAYLGQPESVYIMYYDGTNIVYRTWDGSSISSKTTIVSSPTLGGSIFSAPRHDSHRIGMAYLKSDNNVGFKRISVEPSQFGGGNAITTFADRHYATQVWCHQVVTSSDGVLSFVIFVGRDYVCYSNVYNHSTATWLFSWTAVAKRYWDLHNGSACFKDSSDYVYAVGGGRLNSGVTENIWIKKSDYPLSHASFTLTAFTDISPGSTTSTRGYKFIAVDSDNVIYLLFLGGSEEIYIMERRSGVWSSATTLVSLTDAYNQGSYVVDVILGKESGQKSINIFWNWTDNATQPGVTGGTWNQIELHYMKLIPNGNGTFSKYGADGATLATPVDENDISDNLISAVSFSSWVASTVYSLGAIRVPSTPNGHHYICTTAGTSGGSAPTWGTNHHSTTNDNTVVWKERGIHTTSDWMSTAGGVEIIDEGSSVLRPACIQAVRYNSTPYNVKNITFYKWDGTNWISTIIDNTNIVFNPVPQIVQGNMLYVTNLSTYSSIDEVVKYQSSDYGSTWSSAVRMTNSAYDNRIPQLSYRSGTEQNILYHKRVSKVHGELFLGSLKIGGYWLWRERQRKRIRHGGRG